jgi:hypothetical protein
MASLPPGPPAWSVTLSLRHRGGLEIRAAAENLLPGWGRGGERMSLLLRLRRCLLFSVTSNCGGRPAATTQPGPLPRGSRVVRFLRSRWARLPRATSIWRRKKQPPARAAVPPDCRDQVTRSHMLFKHSLHQCIQFLTGFRLSGFLPACLQRSRTLARPVFWATASTPAATTRFVVVVVVAALAVTVSIVTAFRITVSQATTSTPPVSASWIRQFEHGRALNLDSGCAVCIGCFLLAGRHQQPERRLRQQTDCAMGQVVGVAGASPSQLQLQVSPWCAKARAGVDLQQVDVLSDESHLRCVGARKGSI